MPSRLPRKLSATTAQAIEWNLMVDWLASLRSVRSQNHMVTHRPFGVSITQLPKNLSVARVIRFPFQIYKSPANPDTEADPDEAWRSFRVRGGMVFLEGMGDSPVEKTDAAENPDVDPEPDYDGVNIDFVVPSGEGQHWVWIEITGNAGAYVRTIKHGSDPTTQGWDAYPTLDDRHIPVGYIDTDTRADEFVAVVRQLARTNLIGCPPVS